MTQIPEQHNEDQLSFEESLGLISIQRPDIIPSIHTVEDTFKQDWDNIAGIDSIVHSDHHMNTIGYRVHNIMYHRNLDTYVIYKGTTVRLTTDFGGTNCEFTKDRNPYSLRPSLTVALTIIPNTREIVGLVVIHECDRRAFYKSINCKQMMRDYEGGDKSVVKMHGGGLFLPVYISDMKRVLGDNIDVVEWYHPKYKQLDSDGEVLRYIEGI